LLGGNPAVCNRASGVVICKRGNHDYTKLKACHSVLLLRCMGELGEKVAAGRLSEEAERKGLLSDGQFGRSNGWSAIDASGIMVN